MNVNVAYFVFVHVHVSFSIIFVVICNILPSVNPDEGLDFFTLQG
jgi:uncharacterized membrane protein YagU involved in acid resistance